ncbi:MAG: hypothetical protein R3A80_10345 [Bdellovibrionota bacterium]
MAVSFLGFAFIALIKRATHRPYDYRPALLVDSREEASLGAAFEKALLHKQTLKDKAASVERVIPR